MSKAIMSAAVIAVLFATGASCDEEERIKDCPEDVTQDGVITLKDLDAVRRAYGTVCRECLEDVDGNGKVDLLDIQAVAKKLGQTCPR